MELLEDHKGWSRCIVQQKYVNYHIFPKGAWKVQNRSWLSRVSPPKTKLTKQWWARPMTYPFLVGCCEKREGSQAAWNKTYVLRPPLENRSNKGDKCSQSQPQQTILLLVVATQYLTNGSSPIHLVSSSQQYMACMSRCSHLQSLHWMVKPYLSAETQI